VSAAESDPPWMSAVIAWATMPTIDSPTITHVERTLLALIHSDLIWRSTTAPSPG